MHKMFSEFFSEEKKKLFQWKLVFQSLKERHDGKKNKEREQKSSQSQKKSDLQSFFIIYIYHIILDHKLL